MADRNLTLILVAAETSSRENLRFSRSRLSVEPKASINFSRDNTIYRDVHGFRPTKLYASSQINLRSLEHRLVGIFSHSFNKDFMQAKQWGGSFWGAFSRFIVEAIDHRAIRRSAPEDERY